jgi:hypothetical protein
MKNINKELGTDAEIVELVQRIKQFNFDDANLNELMALSRALQVVSEDIIKQQQENRALQAELRQKIAVTNIVSEMSGVVRAIKNTNTPRSRWLPWG